MLLFVLLVEAAIFVHLAMTLLAARMSAVPYEVVAFGSGPRVAGISCKGTTYELRVVPLGSSAKFVEQAYLTASRGRRLLIAAAPVAAQVVLGTALIGGFPAASDAVAAFARGTVSPSDGGAALAEFARGTAAAPAAAFGAVLVCTGVFNALPLFPSSGASMLIALFGGEDPAVGRKLEAWLWTSMAVYVVLMCLWGWAFVAAIRA